MQRRKHFAVLAVFAFFVLIATESIAQNDRRSRLNGDQQIVEQARLVASGESIELFEHGVRVDPAFLPLLEETYRRIELLLKLPLDKRTLGSRVRIYVTDADVVSHVWRGYNHPSEPLGIIILNRVAYDGAVRRTNATFAHELVHLFTWRFHSHTLREGLADYVALELFPGAAVGPNKNGYDPSGVIPREVRELLGTTIAPPSWVTSDRRMRQSYYAGSYRLVKRLVEKGGLSKFMRLYAARDPEAALLELYGSSRSAVVESL